MSTSPRLNLPYVAPQQAQKHVTVNESLRRLDAITQLSVKSDQVTDEPDMPADGDAYILPAAATGTAWSLMTENAVAAFQDGAWAEIAVREGWRAWVQDTSALKVFTAGVWTDAASGGSSSSAQTFGINEVASTSTRFAVGSANALFDFDQSAGSGDMRLYCNKEAGGDTASFIFETGHSGRAEFGLTGDENFSVNVSSDGSVWQNALSVSHDTGDCVFAAHAGIARERPADFWGSAVDQAALWMPYGYFGTNGSFGLGLWWNGYRNASTAWSSQAINGSSVGAAVELQSGGCMIRYEASPASVSPAIRLRVSAAEVSPGVDNSISLGSPSARWSQVYAGSGTISTSDARDKIVGGGVSAAERRCARAIRQKIKTYRWSASVARKGQNARTHIGITAQDVAEAFRAQGLDPAVYGIWCEDSLDEMIDDPDTGFRVAPKGETRQGLRYEELMLFMIASI